MASDPTEAEVKQLRTSLSHLHLCMKASQLAQRQAVRALANLGFRVWQDLVGADESILAPIPLDTNAREVCIAVIQKANERRNDERIVCSSPKRQRVSDSGGSNSCTVHAARQAIANIDASATARPPVTGLGTTLKPAEANKAIAASM